MSSRCRLYADTVLPLAEREAKNARRRGNRIDPAEVALRLAERTQRSELPVLDLETDEFLDRCGW